MNINQTKNIPLVELLGKSNIFPVRITENRALYYALNRFEKTPSLSIELKKNKAIDYGTGKVYDAVSLIQEIHNCSVSDALKIISEKNFSSFQKQEKFENKTNFEEEKNYRILKVEDEITHPALIQYLQKRKVLEQKKLLKEIHYEVKNKEGIWKKYFSVGFPNQHENSFEISSPIWKGCLGKKDIVLIENDSCIINIFEGFWDYFSFISLEKFHQNIKSDFIILNSLSLLNKLTNFEKYITVFVWFDDDNAGKSCTKLLKNKFKNIKDCSGFYSKKNCKDLNELHQKFY